MTDLETTSTQERLAQLEGMLGGTRSDSRTAQALAGAGKRNVLIGAALHAADRLRQGKAATDLEAKLLEVMRELALPDAEIRDWGRVYRETVQRLGGRIDILPELITRRDVGTGFSVADLKSNFPAVAAEHAARPNLGVLDRQAWAAGGAFDTTAFTDAVRATGMGASAPRTPPTVQPVTPPTYRVKLELENFYVQRAVGDAGGGKDEIYWCVTSSSDKTKGPLFKSETFGAVQQGQTRNFSTSNRVVFNASAGAGVVLHVMVWESDQSSSEWYDKLQLGMQKLCDYLFNSYQWQVGGIIGDPGLGGGMLLEILGMAAFFISIWRNEDDLSCERAFILDQYSLAVLSHLKTTQWNFNGDGYHKLKVNYTGDPVPFPAGTLEYIVKSSGAASYSQPIALPWESMTAPALAFHNNHLYAAFVEPGTKKVMWTRLENGTWRRPEQIGGDQSLWAPALATAHNRLYYAVTGTNNTVSTRIFTDSWGGIKAWSYRSNTSPSLGLFRKQNQMWFTHVGTDEVLYEQHHNGTAWSDSRWDNLDWATRNPVALCAEGDAIVRAARSLEGGRVTFGWNTGGGWRSEGDIPGLSTSHGVAMVQANGGLHLFFRTADGFLATTTKPEPVNRWTTPTRVNDAGKPMDEPAAASHDGNLYVMYRR
ncbi:hypothetical protein [Nocardia sp. NPDC050793]|uniref:hypothetical protein n=1 Tax=Nocardia sp. NPDC050793 TaxID=3155159 RepID=UPI00340A2DC3